jgi:3'-5' exoribonuclease
MTPGEQIADQVFLIHKKDLRTTTNGSLYIHLVLADRTGQLLGRIWSATQQQYDLIPEGGFLRVRGRTESYKGSLQFIVDGMRPVEMGEIDVADFLPRTKYDVEKMWDETLGVLRTVKDPMLLALIKQFVQDKGIVAGYKKAPAAIANHHAYIGGLLEHTLNLMRLATRIFGEKDESATLYPGVSRDLILTGIFLHDIGKITELTYDTNFAYTTGGQLVGHIAQAAIWIDRKAAEVEEETGKPFPSDLQSVLTHIVLAHHGKHEFGSPKLPACAEAMVIHYLDNIDAKVNMALGAIEADKTPESDWTEWVRPLETRIYKGISTPRQDATAP